MGLDNGNPATYVDIEMHQAEIHRTGAPLLWTLVGALRRPGIGPTETKVAEDFFDRIADEVLWAATEVFPNDDWKLLSQRYISMQVRDRWARVFASGARSIKAFTRDPNNKDRVAVKHEHVVPRHFLKKQIRGANTVEEVHALVQRSVGCVVMKEEDDGLPRAGYGWERYLSRVRVFDRKEQVELVLDKVWAAQRAAWNLT